MDRPFMFQLEPFEWTTRLALCERLLALLRANLVPAEVPEHLDDEAAALLDDAWYAQQRLIDLITVVADRSCGPLLRAVLEWPDVEAMLSNQVVYGLAAADAEVPLDELRALFEDPEIHPGPLLCLCRTAAEKELAAELLTRRVDREMASGDGSPLWAFQVLYPSSFSHSHPVKLQIPAEFEALRDRLCDAYMEPEAPAAGRGKYDIHLHLAGHRFREPEARALLRNRWLQTADCEARQYLIWMCPHPEVLAEWLAAKPPALPEILRLLANPTFKDAEAAAKIVAAQYGEEAVLDSIEASIRKAGLGDHTAWESVMASEWYLRHHPGEQTGWRLGSLLTCPDVYSGFKSYLRRAYRGRLWTFRLDEALGVLEEVLTHPDVDPEFLSESITRVTVEPRPEHRGLYHRILTECAEGRLDPGFRFPAIHALESIGEDGPDWLRQLAALAEDDDLCVRLLAIRGLVQRGHSGRLNEAVEYAWEALSPESEPLDHPYGLAVRLLGEFAPRENLEVLQCLVLLGDDGRHNPSPPHEAAYALACLASPEAVVTLVRGCLTAETYVARAIFHYLLAALTRLEGQQIPVEHLISIWRYARFPP